jgi:hypothetical protein
LQYWEQHRQKGHRAVESCGDPGFSNVPSATGATIKVDAARKLTFKPAKALKDALALEGSAFDAEPKVELFIRSSGNACQKKVCRGRS